MKIDHSAVSAGKVAASSGSRPGATTVQNADELIAVLGEEVPHVCDWLRGAYAAMGPELMQSALQTTVEIEANGGMLTKDKSRRRAMAGVFLHVLGQRIPAELRAAWPLPTPQPPKPPKPPKPSAQPTPPQVLRTIDVPTMGNKTVVVEHVRRRGS